MVETTLKYKKGDTVIILNKGKFILGKIDKTEDIRKQAVKNCPHWVLHIKPIIISDESHLSGWNTFHQDWPGQDFGVCEGILSIIKTINYINGEESEYTIR